MQNQNSSKQAISSNKGLSSVTPTALFFLHALVILGVYICSEK